MERTPEDMRAEAPEGPTAPSTLPSASERVVALVHPEVVERARRGDLEAFEEIYRKHVGRVYALCLRLLAHQVRAEEATQEVFLKAWRGLPGFEGRAAVSTWLHRLAVNVAMDERRADARRERWIEPQGGDEEVFRDAESPLPPPEITMDLERAIEGLPSVARTAFVLHDVEGYRHREIAEMTGTPEGTWRARLHAARRMLRERLSA